jgi:DNA-binding NtrC family response regulator
MYRLRVIPVFLPALRERREDIALLCGKLIETFNQTRRRRVERIAPATLSVLERQDWPGNIRELQNVLAYAYTMGDGPILEVSDLPPELVEQANTAGPANHVSTPPGARELDPESQHILAVLARTNGNKNRAAQILGMSRVTLWRRLRELGHEA